MNRPFDYSASPLLQGDNARARFTLWRGSMAQLQNQLAALREKVLMGDREAALQTSVLKVQIEALGLIGDDLEAESNAEKTEIEHQARALSRESETATYERQQQIKKEISRLQRAF